MRSILAEFLAQVGVRVGPFTRAGELLNEAVTEPYELCILEEQNGSEYGLAELAGLVGSVRQHDPRMEIVVVTNAPSGSAPALVACGAGAVLAQPLDLASLATLVESLRADFAARRQIGQLERELDEMFTFEGMVSRSPGMLEIFHTLRAIAPYDSPVLLMGETGTGKELVAQALHRLSTRAKHRLVVANCAALPETLAESALFGHVRGAFTGALESHAGVFERADGGTLFLDEVGELPIALQAKLLRTLQLGEVQKVGGGDPLRVDVRVIAATNRDLRQEVAAGRFRQDLYYRLAVLEIRLPPLRDRKEDIPLLCRRFLREFNRRFGKQVRGFSRRAQDALLRWDWQGNVRELENVIERAFVVARREFVDVDDLPAELQTRGHLLTPPPAHSNNDPASSDVTLEEVELRHIRAVLEACQGNRSLAARRLRISRRTLLRKLRRLNEARPCPQVPEPLAGPDGRHTLSHLWDETSHP